MNVNGEDAFNTNLQKNSAIFVFQYDTTDNKTVTIKNINAYGLFTISGGEGFVFIFYTMGDYYLENVYMISLGS